MKSRLIKPIKARPRLVIAVLLGGLLLLALQNGWRQATRVLFAWDCSTGLYLVLALSMMARSDVDRIRDRAAMQDEGQVVILGLTTITALVSLAGIMVELATAKPPGSQILRQPIALAGITVILSWAFLHTMYAIHYAHEYYSPDEGGRAEGLEFPGHEPPDYWDFMYYSFVIGTACATADVDVISKGMRRTTALHCIVSFFFNTTILALTVNIGAGLF
jgi:uncharacterized membrane protein